VTHRKAATIASERLSTHGDPWNLQGPRCGQCQDCEDRSTCLLERPREGEACRHYWLQGGSDGTASP